jgi:hypothetical protein
MKSFEVKNKMNTKLNRTKDLKLNCLRTHLIKKAKMANEPIILNSSEDYNNEKNISVNKKIKKKPRKFEKVFQKKIRSGEKDLIQKSQKTKSLKKSLNSEFLNGSISTKFPSPLKSENDKINSSETIENSKLNSHAEKILNYLTSQEQIRISNSSMEVNFNQQKEINIKMRNILINWIILVHKNFKLKEDTLFLAFTIIDRYTARNNIDRNQYQLLGITALYMASKFEEIYPPKLDKFVYVCDNAFSKKDLVLFEASILKSLDYNVYISTSFYFLKTICFILNINSNSDIFQRCCYNLHLMSFDLLSCSLKENLKCFISLFFTLRVFDQLQTLEQLSHYDFFKFEDLEFFQSSKNFENFSKSMNLQQFSAIRTKFCASQFFENI